MTDINRTIKCGYATFDMAILHLIPFIALVLIGLWCGSKPSAFWNDYFIAVALVYGVPSTVSLWRILFISMGKAISIFLDQKWQGVSPLLLAGNAVKATHVALWILIPTIFCSAIALKTISAQIVYGSGELLGIGSSITHALFVLWLGSIAQQVRIFAAAVEYYNETFHSEITDTFARGKMYGVWVIWSAMPMSLWIVGMGLTFGILPFDTFAVICIDLPMFCLLIYATHRAIMALKKHRG